MKENSIGFNLGLIRTEQFAMFEDQFSAKKAVDLESKFHFKLNREAKRIGVFTTFQFEQSKKPFIKLVTSCHFNIEEGAWNEFTNEIEIRFPASFVRHLGMLTVGTARGILHCKTEGTPFNEFILPTINVAEMVKKDVVFVWK